MGDSQNALVHDHFCICSNGVCDRVIFDLTELCTSSVSILRKIHWMPKIAREEPLHTSMSTARLTRSQQTEQQMSKSTYLHGCPKSPSRRHPRTDCTSGR